MIFNKSTDLLSLLLLLIILLNAELILSLRCKCNTDKGATDCNGDYCDVHNVKTKRSACGAVRINDQTYFACVRIKSTSNDTYCHVINNATACWCRDIDFCNADLESDLYNSELERKKKLLKKQLFESKSMLQTPFVITASVVDDIATTDIRTATVIEPVTDVKVTAEIDERPWVSGSVNIQDRKAVDYSNRLVFLKLIFSSLKFTMYFKIRRIYAFINDQKHILLLDYSQSNTSSGVKWHVLALSNS